MTQKLAASVGMFGVVDGNVQEDAPNVLAARAPVSAADKGSGQLYVVSEVLEHSLAEEELYSEILQALSDAYYRLPGTVTARLQDALREANALLLHANSGLSRSEWLTGGITCMVMTGSDLYIAQAGPSALYLVQRGQARRYPAASPWIDNGAAGSSTSPLSVPLGLRPGIQPDLFHCLVQPGDTVVLMTTGLAQMIGPAEVAEAVAGRKLSDSLYNLARQARETDGACIVIQMHPPRPDAGGDAVREAPMPPEPHADELSDLDAEAPTPPVESPTEAASIWPSLAPAPAPVEEADLDEESWLPPAQALPQEPPAPAPRPEGALRPAQAARPPMSPSRPAARPVTVYDDTPPLRPNPLREVADTIGLGARTIGQALGLRGARDRSAHAGRPAASRAYRPAQRRGFPLWTIPLGIVVVVALGVFFATQRQQQARNREYADLIARAESQATTGTTAPDAAGKRTALVGALDLYRQALSLRPEDSTAQLGQAQVQAVLDQVEGVVRLQPRLLYSYADVPDARTTRIVLGGQSVYVLDGFNSRVMQHTLDGAEGAVRPETSGALVLSRGQPVAGVPMGDMADIVWVDAAGSRSTGGLMVVGKDRTLVELDRRWGASRLRLAGTEQWSDPYRVKSYLGNLYVLDRGANQIWKNVPSADGYGTPPTGYYPASQSRDLGAAVDLAIDGSVYVLLGDGRLEKYTTGTRQSMELRGLVLPLRSPTAIFTMADADVKFLYIAEPAEQRVVQLKKTGEFVRAFKPAAGPEFGSLADLYVDESLKMLFFVAGSSLYACNLP